MTRHADGKLTTEGWKELRALLWKGFFALMAAAGSGGVWILVSQAKEYGNNFVAQSPATLANAEAIAEAKIAVSSAIKSADTANSKADQSIALQNRILDAVKALHEDADGMKLTFTASNATLAAQIAALGEQVDRIEARQDNPK